MRSGSTAKSRRTISRTFITSFSLSSPRFAGSCSAGVCGLRVAGESRPAAAVPAARVVPERRHDDEAVALGEIDHALVAHHPIERTSEAVQRDDERPLLRRAVGGRHEQRVGNRLAGVGKDVGPFLDALVGGDDGARLLRGEHGGESECDREYRHQSSTRPQSRAMRLTRGRPWPERSRRRHSTRLDRR